MAEPLFVVAIDPASRTGIAYGHIGAVPILTRIDLKKNGDKALEAYKNAALMAQRQFQESGPVDVLAIETPIWVTYGKTNADTVAMAQGLYAIFTGVAQANGIVIMPVAPRTWRAHFLGRGNLDRTSAKAAALRRCKQLHWETHDDEDAGDAAGIWDWACSQLKVPGLLARCQEEAQPWPSA
jgi:hypothetical protein